MQATRGVVAEKLHLGEYELIELSFVAWFTWAASLFNVILRTSRDGEMVNEAPALYGIPVDDVTFDWCCLVCHATFVVLPMGTFQAAAAATSRVRLN